MEGLEISEVQLNEIYDVETHRLDSEYQKKKYLDIADLIDKRSNDFTTFEEINLKVDASAFYPSLEPYYGQGNVPFIRVADVDKHINYDNCIRIPEEIVNDPAFKTLKVINEGDIIVTKGGSIGRVGLIQKATAVTRDLIFINSSELSEVDYKFLYLYLLSDFSFNLMIRSSSMTAQPHLTIKLIRKLPLFIASDKFKINVSELYDESQQLKKKSEGLYTQAETILLKEIGLENFSPSIEGINIKSLSSSFLTSGRLDAEYYHPKFDQIEDIVKSRKHIYISNIKTTNHRGQQPKYFEDGNLNVINSKHILENTLDYENFNKTKEAFWDLQEKSQVFNGDILTYTTGANIGRTQVYKSHLKALASNHVNILRINGYKPEYIGFVMNSVIGRMQTEKHSAGSAQAELYPKDIDNFIIPVIDESKQNQIISFLDESNKLRNLSFRLLENAKQAVEIAIEQDEKTAIEFINQNKITDAS